MHSDWPLYDIEGQNGHIHDLKLSYVKNLAPGLYGSAHAGLLEPFFAGVGENFSISQHNGPLALGLISTAFVKELTTCVLICSTMKRQLATSAFIMMPGVCLMLKSMPVVISSDWGATTTISRKFGSGWEVGGYATLTDVPFATFGEGSFDKAIYVSVPIDWIISSPTRSKRRLTLRPITRDGGANLSSARNLYRQIENFQNSALQREFGRLWR